MSTHMNTEEEKSDIQLVKEFQSGSRKRFDELINRHSGKIFQVAYGLLGNRQDAEEVAQDTFLSAYKNLDCEYFKWSVVN